MPQRIFKVRDGVAHSGFAVTCQPEIDAIWRACNRFRGGFNPDLVFIVVQKTNINKMYLVKPAGPQGQVQYVNLPPGSCVDKYVTQTVENEDDEHRPTCTRMGLIMLYRVGMRTLTLWIAS